MKPCESICRLSRLLLSACFAVIHLSTNAQQEGYKLPPPQEGYRTPAPDVWQFMKYGNHQPSLYTGTVNVSIPIYTYEDKDFKIPISVDYASNGFIPNQQTGILGMGWGLNAGGCITREVREVPDDKMENEGFPGDGYWNYYNKGGTPDWDQVIEHNQTQFSSELFVFQIGKEYIETQSDIYHFRFLDHSGTFCLGPNKTVYVYDTNHPHGEYQIDVSNIKDRATIKITTGDGFEYTFEASAHLDFIALTGTAGTDNYGMPSTWHHLSWMLTKITAPDKNRTVEFMYSEEKIFDICKPYSYGMDEVRKLHVNGSGWLTADYIRATFGDVSNFIMYGSQYGINLNEIRIDNKISITFNYQDKTPEKKKNDSSSKPKPMNNMGALGNIVVRNIQNADTLKKCRFTYTVNNSENGNPVTFLKRLQLSGEEPYRFNYYDEKGLYPYHGTSAIDHWGFYNKWGESDLSERFDPSNIIPTYAHDSLYNEIIETKHREPVFSGALMGMLKEIIYPTKGYSRFEYEEHEYSMKVGRNFTSNCNPVLIDRDQGGYNYGTRQAYPAGGVRIKKITDYASSQDSTYRRFYYQTPDGKSSGIALHYPRYAKGYHIRFRSGDSYVGFKIHLERSGTDLIGLSMDKSHIGYSSVREEFANGSCIETHFSNYKDTPDDWMPDLIRPIGSPDRPSEIVNPTNAINLFRVPISFHRQRGKMLRRSAYDNKGNILQKTIYRYDKDCTKKYAEDIYTMPGLVYVHKTLVSDLPLIEQTDIQYLNRGADSIVTIKRFTYNDHGQSVGTVTEYPGITESAKTEYVTDYVAKYTTNAPYYSVCRNMVDKNFKSYPIRVQKTINSKLTEGLLNIYSFNGIFPVLSSVLKTELSSPVICSDFNFDSHLVAEDSYQYDSMGNLVQVQMRDGRFISFICGYGGLYRIAIIENASREQLCEKLGDSVISDTPLAEALSEAQIESLKTIPNVSVTTYKYKPFIGIISVTDPSGRQMNYRYDNFGRLKAVIDEKNNFIEDYEYNFNIQNK